MLDSVVWHSAFFSSLMAIARQTQWPLLWLMNVFFRSFIIANEGDNNDTRLY